MRSGGGRGHVTFRERSDIGRHRATTCGPSIEGLGRAGMPAAAEGERAKVLDAEIRAALTELGRAKPL